LDEGDTEYQGQTMPYKYKGRVSNFQDEWAKKLEFFGWLTAARSCRDKAHCKLCLKIFDIGNMGISAVFSHMQSKKHKRLLHEQNENASVHHSLGFAPATDSSVSGI
jgi:hypothetical protein